ncbi:MAG: thermostable hemolysin, partial [Methyloceanibacter sp.]|nr:thermostable hemolysin [Methyloceanibacter sp.]
MRAAIIPRGHDLRAAAEQLIAEVYALHYSARITAFPATLVAMVSDRDALLCAAGLRFAADGFFSECYLEAPVDAVLTGLWHSP